MSQDVRVFCPIHRVYESPQTIAFIAGGIQFITPGHSPITWDGKTIEVTSRVQANLKNSPDQTQKK